MGIRVLLAEDHLMFRQGLNALLVREGIEVAADVENGLAAVSEWPRAKADVAILDLAMPMLNGIDAAREILRSSPHGAVILLTMYNEDRYVMEALQAGVTGYVLKTNAAEDLLNAIRERQVLQLVAEGRTTKEVASILNRSVKTADSHRQRIMNKLNAHSTAAIVRYTVRRGLIQA